MKQNKLLIILIAFFAIVAFTISCSDSSDSITNTSASDCPTKTCGDFTTQSQAQATYNSNKSCYKNLDADGDGIACENLKK